MNEKYASQLMGIKENMSRMVEEMEISSDPNTLMNYYYLCSNLKHFLSKRTMDYRTFYKEVLINREMGHNDFFNKNFGKSNMDNWNVTTDNWDIKEIFNTPKIFCSYHLGSYRLLSLFLSKIDRKDKLAFVLDNNSYNNQSDITGKVVEDLVKNHRYRAINAESPSGIFEMIRFVREGGSLLFFIDGNSGIGSMHHKKNMLDVNLLGAPFLTRKGIAEIAYITNTPIVPILTFRESSNIFDNTIQICKPISVEQTKNKEKKNEIIHKITQNIYDVFEPYLQKYTTQWEGWLYFQFFIEQNTKPVISENTVKDIELKKLIFNEEQFGLIDLKNEHYLYDMDNRSLYKISNKIYELITFFKVSSERELLINEEIKGLVKNKILIFNDFNC